MGKVLQLNLSGSNQLEDWKKVAYRAIDNLMENLKDKIGGKDLEELSNFLRDEGRGVTGALLESILNDQVENASTSTHCPCEKCNRLLKFRRIGTKNIETQHGNINIKRPYFYCEHCQHGFYPFDQKQGIAPQKKQYDLQRAAADLLTELPFETASELFKRITGLSITDHCIHNEGERIGEVAELEDVLPSKKKVEATIEELTNGRVWRPVMVVATDGAHLPTRPESYSRNAKRGAGSWQEAKGFRIYLVGQDKIVQLMSWHQISNDEEFGEALNFASTLIPHDKVRIALIGDGAPWLWSKMKEAFPTGKEILDYFHCSEHIHKVADLQYKDDKNQQAMWIESTMSRLNFGDVEAVIWGLQRMKPNSNQTEEEIRKLVGYLKRNKHRIDYNSVKRGQYPRGSGGIESANKFICHVRMKRSGAWWYKINGNKMLKLRCAKINGTFDEIFSKYKRRQKSEKILTSR